MSRSVVRAGVDTFVWSAKPKKNFKAGKWLRVAQSTKRSYIRLKSPAPKNATILSATLVLTQVDDVTGSHTVTAQRVGEAWNAGTITWDKQPAVTGPTAAVTKTGSDAGDVWEIDVTALLQDVADGEPYYGLRLVNSNSNELRFYSLNSSKYRPHLEVVWTTAPEAPTVLKPAYGAVSKAKPVLSCDYTDHSGSTDLIAMQVQINATNDFSSPDWDTATSHPTGYPVDVPQLDLADTDFPGITAGTTVWWRVRVKDGDGLWSEWSDGVPIARYAKGSVTIVSPGADPNDFVSEFTPPIVWSFTGGTQTHFRVTIAKANSPKKLLHDSGKIKGTDDAYTIPKKVLAEGIRYVVVVQVWDDIEREATAGDAVYADSSQEFTVEFDPTVDAPDSLTVEQVGVRPWVDVIVGRSTAPDSWTIVRDGVAIDTDVDVADLEVGDIVGGVQTYIYRDYTARPEVPHTYRVRAEVNGKLSHGGPTADITIASTAIWLADPDTGQEIVLGGLDFDTAQTDNAETFTRLGTTGVVRSVMGLNGLSGSLNGATVRDRDGFTWYELEATLEDFKGRPADEFRLVFGDENIPVVLGDLRCVPSRDTYTGAVEKAVYCTFWQTDEYRFDVSV